MSWGLGVGWVWFDWSQAPGGLTVGQAHIKYTEYTTLWEDTENTQHRRGTRLNFWICDTRGGVAKRHEQGSWAGGRWTVFGIFLVGDWSAAQSWEELHKNLINCQETHEAWWLSWASSAFNNDVISASLESNRLLVEIKNSNPSLLYILSTLLNVVVLNKRISGGKNLGSRQYPETGRGFKLQQGLIVAQPWIEH